MTEAGEKWVEECANGHYPITVHREEAEFWLRAFCDEVEMRAYLHPSTGWQKSMIQSFDELKRELLGE